MNGSECYDQDAKECELRLVQMLVVPFIDFFFFLSPPSPCPCVQGSYLGNMELKLMN